MLNLTPKDLEKAGVLAGPRPEYYFAADRSRGAISVHNIDVGGPFPARSMQVYWCHLACPPELRLAWLFFGN
ncbi:MAG TPA: hypothetical protein VEC99_16370 [Clostridia bacterium]|nr:hypothetical protein [Clostridia bacterium]